jgi:uncharacterized membrane protein
MTDEIEQFAPSPMPTPVMSTNRLEAFSDGVFAIVITLLILELKLPSGPEPLGVKLGHMIPQIIAYAVAFILVGMTWVGHHGLFHVIKRVDKTLMWLNMTELLFISFIPFPTMVLGTNPMDPGAIQFFATVLFLGSVAFNAIWWYASRGHRLIDRGMEPERIRLQWKRSLIMPIFCMIGFLGTLMSVWIGLAALMIPPLIYILPSRFDPRHFKA